MTIFIHISLEDNDINENLFYYTITKPRYNVLFPNKKYFSDLPLTETFTKSLRRRGVTIIYGTPKNILYAKSKMFGMKIQVKKVISKENEHLIQITMTAENRNDANNKKVQFLDNLRKMGIGSTSCIWNSL